MFLEKKTSDKDVDMGLCYSILHKCIRRCLVNEALYYGKLIYEDGTPNALRKRLIMYCIEDMGRLDLALEIFDCDKYKLFTYIQIVAKNKKSRITDWYRIVCNNLYSEGNKSDNEELNEGLIFREYEVKDDFKSIRKFLGKDLSKLYTFMDRNSFVWILKLLWEKREELRYPLDREINKFEKPIKFDKIPNYVMDKHVINGTPGLKFFFENGAVIFNKIYEIEPYEKEAKKIVFQ